MKNIEWLYRSCWLASSVIDSIAIEYTVDNGVDTGDSTAEWLMAERDGGALPEGGPDGARDLRAEMSNLARDLGECMAERDQLRRRCDELQAAYDEASGLAADLCRAFGFSVVDASGDAVS